MRDNERDALVRWAELCEKGHGHTVALELREALAAPAEGVDVQTIALIANMAAYIRAEGGENAGALLSHADKLIDSAGGAKCTGADCKPRDGGTLCQSCGGDITPQPAKDDAAVADALMAVNGAANDARHAGDYAKANALVRARVTLYRASARPAATPVVPDGFVLVPREATITMIDAGARQIPDEWPNGTPVDRDDLRDLWDDMLAAAPAAPKGGVVDEEIEVKARLLFAKYADKFAFPWDQQWEPTRNYWRDKARAALSTGEQP